MNHPTNAGSVVKNTTKNKKEESLGSKTVFLNRRTYFTYLFSFMNVWSRTFKPRCSNGLFEHQTPHSGRSENYWSTAV